MHVHPVHPLPAYAPVLAITMTSIRDFPAQLEPNRVIEAQ